MTDGKKAIATLAGLKMMVGTKAKEVCDVAISALQEREERSKGCVYCNDVAIDIELPNANFCPMCGRPLKGEDNGKAD